MANKDLNKARKNKHDEFYTQLDDIENELLHYKDKFKDKVVFCNCDDPTYSNFWYYFVLNFENLGLKRLISTHYISDENQKSYKLELTKQMVKENKLYTSPAKMTGGGGSLLPL